MRLFDGWRNLSLLGTLLTFGLSLTFLLSSLSSGYYCTILNPLYIYSLEDSTRLFLTIATSLQWFTILQYWRYTNRYTISSLILWGAFFKIQQILISILPIAIGLMFLGILLFGNSSYSFNSIPNIIITIYSVMNCDSIWDTFTATNSDENISVVGTIYVSIIFILFHYLTLRVILAIVETLYFYLKLFMTAQRKRKYYRKYCLQSSSLFIVTGNNPQQQHQQQQQQQDEEHDEEEELNCRPPSKHTFFSTTGQYSYSPLPITTILSTTSPPSSSSSLTSAANNNSLYHHQDDPDSKRSK